MNSSNVTERRNKIMNLLVKNGIIRIGEVAQLFNVSTETIRKDIIYLEDKGIAQKEHGGASAANEKIERHIALRNYDNIEIKNKIAERALSFIPNNGAIALDTGSTTLCLANMLSVYKDLTIITNSLLAVDKLINSENSIYLIGGKIKNKSMSMVGTWGLNSINSIKPEVVFLGSSGVYNHDGPCGTSFEDAEIKKAYVNQSSTSVVLIDSSKFTKTSLIECVKWSDIDVVITDSGLSEEYKKDLSTKTDLIIVNLT